MNIFKRILGVLTILVGLAAPVVWNATQADARVVQLEEPEFEQMGRNPVLYVERVTRRWFYIELSDGSTWMVTRCRHEDSNNCWWDAKRRGNGEGRSFVVIHRHYHLTVKATVGP